MPIFYQTGHSQRGAIVRDTYDCGFTTVWRAKDKGTRIRIAAIAKAVHECGGTRYSRNARAVLANRIKQGGNFASRLKIAKTKSKGATTDCTGFAGACMYGAGHPMLIRGWMPNSTSLCSTPDGTFAHYKKLKYKTQLANKTLQRGDIVAKSNHHGAVIAESMSGINEQEYFFKHYYHDGSKKNTYKKKKSEKIRKNVKKYKKTIKKKAKKSKQALKNYLNTLKKQRKTINSKWKKYKNKKNKTKAQQVYQDRLKDTLDKIDKAITATEKAIKNYKKPKKRPKKRPKKKKAKKKNKNTKKGSNQTKTNNNNTNNNGQPDEYTYKIESINTEPVITPEKIDWYYIRSGLNYFSEEEIYDSKNQKVRHKDYMGKIYCKRKIKIPTIDITSDYWEFNFDMPFNICNSFSAGIKRAEKVNGDNTQWRYYLNKNGLGQIQGGAYTIKMKTKVGIEYEIRCEITTYYDE